MTPPFLVSAAGHPLHSAECVRICMTGKCALHQVPVEPTQTEMYRNNKVHRELTLLYEGLRTSSPLSAHSWVKATA